MASGGNVKKAATALEAGRDPHAVERIGGSVTKHRIDFGAINCAALRRLPEILDRLLPGGKVFGSEYVVRNPKRADRSAVFLLIAYLDDDTQSSAARKLAWMLGVDLGGRHA